MTQVKSSKLLKTIALATVFAYPLVNAIPKDFEQAIAQSKLIGAEKPGTSNALMIEPTKTALDVYVAHSDVALVSHDKGDREKIVRANEFTAMTQSSKLCPDKRVATNSGELVKVPEKDRLNFKIVVSTKFNGKPIKAYKMPSDNTAETTKFMVATDITCDDLTLYNNHFLKARDLTGKPFYVDIDQVNWTVTSTNPKQYRILGDKGSYHITEKVKNLTLDPHTPSGLTANEISAVLADTGLAGIENAAVDIEDKYGINALFTIALASLESGNGESYLARTRNNLFGIAAYDSNVDAASSFASKDACVRYWGELIDEVYFANGRTTLESINAIYASNPNWASMVRSLMSQYAGRLQ